MVWIEQYSSAVVSGVGCIRHRLHYLLSVLSIIKCILA